jgi:hypothetical protein
MPKKTLKRLSPTPHRIRNIRSLQVLGKWLHEPSLWHVTRVTAARAFAIGIFCAMLPFPGQAFVAAILAVLARANLPLSVILIFITNPVTMPVIYFSAYKLGAFLLSRKIEWVQFEFSWQWFSNGFLDIWQPFVLGCFVLGITGAALAYFLIDVTWRMRVAQQWRKRAKRSPRAPGKPAAPEDAKPEANSTKHAPEDATSDRRAD